jgi:putative ABC transport system permease protein
MRARNPRPPRAGLWLLRNFAGPADFEFAVGDLTETFEQLAETEGTAKARRWFLVEAIKAVPGFIKNALYWKISMFRNYAVIALRNMLRDRIFAVINLLGLAVGMACFILISLWIRDELSYDRFHAHKDRLYQVIIIHPNGIHDPNSPYALAPALADEYSEIEAQTRIFELGAIRTCSFRHQSPGRPPAQFYESQVVLVDPAFFSMFSFPFKSGSPETALQTPSSVVISEGAAARYFGSENPLGKSLTFNSRADLTVTGVVRVPANSHLRFDFVASLDDPMSSNWDWADPSYLLLREGVNLPEFREKIAGSMNRHFPNPLPGQFKVDLLPITKAYLHFGRKAYVYIFSVVAVFILLIACINYMNLATARSSSRAREVGLRKVVGARHGQLVQQFLGESVLMTGLALVLTLLLVKLSLPTLNSLTAKQLSFNLFQNPGMVLFIIGLAVAVGIFSGLYPAFFLSTVRPAETLKASSLVRSGRPAFRLITVVGQFAISIFLIACTVMVFKQLNFMKNRPLGFRTDHVVKIPVNEPLLRQFMSLKNELQSHPGILNVTAGQAVPYDDDYKTGVDWDGKDPSFIPLVRYSITQVDYIETFGMEMVAGRNFSPEHPDDWNNFVINEEAARYMKMEEPVGKRLRFWGREGTIIGVVKDYHQVSLHREILPQVLTVNPRLHNALKYIFIKIRADNIPETLRVIQEAMVERAPTYPFEYSFVDRGVDSLYVSEQRLGKIFSYFAILAVVISCLGIFGLSAFMVEKRTKEIGVRKVMGASILTIVAMLSRDFGRWLTAANLIAWPVGWYAMHRWLQNFAYRTDLTVGIFLAATGLAFLAAAVPAGYHALRAASGNPADALRYE